MLVLAASTSWAADAPAAKTLKVLSLGSASLTMVWSPRWELEPNAPGLPADSVAFRTEDKLAMLAYLSKGPMREGESGDEGIRLTTSVVAQRYRSQAVEENIELQRMAGERVHGYYFCITDRAPKPDEYKYMCQGMASVDGTLVVFNVLYNDAGKDEAHEVVTAIKSLQLSVKT